jgi:hypothetical protein
MRYLSLIMAIIMGAACPSEALAGYAKVFQSGAWEGTAYYHDGTGTVALCAVSTDYKNGFRLSIVLQAGGGWSLLFVRPEGFSNAPIQYSLYAGGKLIHSGQETPESGGQLLRIDIPFSKETLDSLQRGTELRVSSAYGDTAFSLKGSADAIAGLRRCVTRQALNAFGPAREKDQSRVGDRSEAAKDESASPRIVTREQLIPYAKEILQNAGLADYRFLPQDADEKGSGVLTWQFEDGSYGSLAAVEKAGSLDIDRFIGDITAADTTSCKGEFANGKAAPRYVNGVEIRKVFASCNAGSRSFYAEYALVRMPNGFLVKLTSAKSGSSTMFGRENQGLQSAPDRVSRTEESTFALFANR